jgi:hypothetical protein
LAVRHQAKTEDLYKAFEYDGEDLLIFLIFETEALSAAFRNDLAYNIQMIYTSVVIYDLKCTRQVHQSTTYIMLEQYEAFKIHQRKAWMKTSPTHQLPQPASETTARLLAINPRQAVCPLNVLGVKPISCHLINKCMLPVSLEKDISNVVVASNFIHGHIDGGCAQGDLIAVIKPYSRATNPTTDGLYEIVLDICYHHTSRDLCQTLAPHFKEGAVLVDLASQSFPRAWRLSLWVSYPDRFLYCVAWKFYNGLNELGVPLTDPFCTLFFEPSSLPGTNDLSRAVRYHEKYRRKMNDDDIDFDDTNLSDDDFETPSQ